MKGNLIPSYP